MKLVKHPTMLEEAEKEVCLSKKKRNVSVACANCQRRRRKCDGERPCGYCLTNGKECTYKIEEDRRRRAYTASKIQELENQNTILKSLLEKYLDKEAITDPDYLNYLKSDKESTDNLESSFTEEISNRELRKDLDDKKMTLSNVEMQRDTNKNFSRAVEDLTEMIWKLQIGPSNTIKFIGPTSNRITKLTESIDINSPNAADDLSFTGFGRSENEKNGPQILSQPEFLKKLLHIYVVNFVQFNVALRDCDFNSLLNEYLCNENPQAIDEVSILFLHTIFAYSFNILPPDDPNKVLLGASNQFLAEVESNILLVLDKFTDMEWNSQKNVFFILITLASLYLGDNNECKGWSYNSLLSAQVIHLGLHVNSKMTKYIPISSSKDNAIAKIVQERTIMFWTCFGYDRLSTTIFGRSCVINNRRVLTDFFICHDPSDENMLLFQYDSKLWYVFEKYMDEIYSFHYEEYDSSKKLILLVSALRKYSGCYTELLHTLPLTAGSLNTSSLPLLLFHLKYHVCLLFFYRPYIQVKEYSSSILGKCLYAVNKSVMLVRAIERSIKYYEYPFYYGYLLSSVLIFMELLFTLKHFKTSRLQDAFTDILVSLKRASRLWPSLHIYFESLFQRAMLWNLDDKIVEKFFTPIAENSATDQSSGDIFAYNFDDELDASKLISDNESMNKFFGLDEESSLEFMEAARYLGFEM